MAAGTTRWKTSSVWLSRCASTVSVSLCSQQVYLNRICMAIMCSFLSSLSAEKCPSGWHHYEKTASCYKVYLKNENYWQAVDTCQKVNGSLATFVTNEELQFILKIEVDFDDKVCRDQCK